MSQVSRTKGKWVKTAALKNPEMEALMQTIYEENPKFFPYGLSLDNFNGQSDKVFEIRNTDSKKICGWVGVQNRDGNVYMSVGLDKDVRGKGVAHKFAQKIIDMYKNTMPEGKHIYWSVDKDNKPSQALAKKLTDIVIKEF